MKKKLLSLLLGSVMVAGLLSGCSGSTNNEQTTNVTNAPTQSPDQSGEAAVTTTLDYPAIDFNSEAVYGIGPDGETAGTLADVMLTDDEKAQVKAGNFKVAFCYGQLDNQVNQTKLALAKAVFEELGIEVVSVTDGQSNADKIVSDIETSMALKPDAMLAMPYDPVATAAALKEVSAAGTKLVLMENKATGLVAKQDYVTIVNSDSYGNGKYAADIMARELGYKGTVAMVVYDVPFFTTNERDRAFKETIEKSYPDIKIVDEVGFTDISRVGEAADGLFANYPDVDAVYASWDIPAEDVIASAKAIGRDDLIMTTVDLGENSASMIAANGIIRGSGVPRASESGQIEAYAVACALIGKEIPTYLCSASQPIAHENILEGYEKCLGIKPPQTLIDTFNASK